MTGAPCGTRGVVWGLFNVFLQTGGSGGYLSWSLSARRGAALHLFASVDRTGPTCDGQARPACFSLVVSSQLFVVQGEGFGNCDNALGQTCVNNVSVGDEGSCRCRSPSVPDESLPVVTPHGCCTSCAPPLLQCWQGLCRCRGSSAPGPARSGAALVCPGTTFDTAVTGTGTDGPAPGDDGLSAGAAGGLAAGLVVLALLTAALLLVVGCRARRARRARALGALDSATVPMMAPAQRSGPAGGSPRAGRAAGEYEEDNEYSVQDFL